jgi:hypothetical protein
MMYLEENVVFFLAQGLNTFVWANWRLLSTHDKEHLTGGVTAVLKKRSDIPPFARSKVEQILASICALSGSLSPVLNLVVEASAPGAELGLSALRIALEEMLSNDSKLTPTHKKALVSVVNEVNHLSFSLCLFILNARDHCVQIALPTTALVCRVCTEIIQSRAADGAMIISALDILRVIVAKLPIGPHLGAGVLDVLCALVERTIAIPPTNKELGGSADDSSSAPSPTRMMLAGNTSLRYQQFSRSAIAAIGVLNELMGKLQNRLHVSKLWSNDALTPTKNINILQQNAIYLETQRLERIPVWIF